jgi:hypothetical protein
MLQQHTQQQIHTQIHTHTHTFFTQTHTLSHTARNCARVSVHAPPSSKRWRRRRRSWGEGVGGGEGGWRRGRMTIRGMEEEEIQIRRRRGGGWGGRRGEGNNAQAFPLSSSHAYLPTIISCLVSTNLPPVHALPFPLSPSLSLSHSQNTLLTLGIREQSHKIGIYSAYTSNSINHMYGRHGALIRSDGTSKG